MDMEESRSKLWEQLFGGCHEKQSTSRPTMLSINFATKSMPEIRTLATFSKLVMQHSTAQPAVIGGEAAHKAMLELGQLYEDLEKGVRNVSPYESVGTLDHCIAQLKLENGGPRDRVQIAALHDAAMGAITSAIK